MRLYGVPIRPLSRRQFQAALELFPIDRTTKGARNEQVGEERMLFDQIDEPLERRTVEAPRRPTRRGTPPRRELELTHDRAGGLEMIGVRHQDLPAKEQVD